MLALPVNLNNSKDKKSQMLSLFFGGILPIIAFTVIEEKYGIFYGLIAGLFFGAAEIIYELVRYRKVSQMTLIGNGLILVMGSVSLFLNDGIWFKLQPAIFEFGFFIFLFGTWIFKKPFLKSIIEKQNPEIPEFFKNKLSGITFRLSLFFLVQSVIAVYAAYYWSTEAWAILKGVGLFVSMAIYMATEMLWIKFNLKNKSDLN